jgi:hypothetical protein
LQKGQQQTSKPTSSFALQLPHKMLTIILEEGYVFDEFDISLLIG